MGTVKKVELYLEHGVKWDSMHGLSSDQIVERVEALATKRASERQGSGQLISRALQRWVIRKRHGRLPAYATCNPHWREARNEKARVALGLLPRAAMLNDHDLVQQQFLFETPALSSALDFAWEACFTNHGDSSATEHYNRRRAMEAAAAAGQEAGEGVGMNEASYLKMGRKVRRRRGKWRVGGQWHAAKPARARAHCNSSLARQVYLARKQQRRESSIDAHHCVQCLQEGGSYRHLPLRA